MSALKPVIQSWRPRYYGLARVGPSTILRTQYARTNVPVGRLEHVRTGTPRAGARERGVWSRTADGAEPRASVTDGDVPIPAGGEEDRGPRPVVHLTRASGVHGAAGRPPAGLAENHHHQWLSERAARGHRPRTHRHRHHNCHGRPHAACPRPGELVAKAWRTAEVGEPPP
jgi:hypothetical protein